MGLATDEPTAKDVLEMCEIIFTKESKKKLGLIKQRNKEYGSKTFTDTKSDYIYR